MTSNSCGVRGWFLFRMASGMAIFPMSWRAAALEMLRISRSVSPYSGQLRATSSSRIWVRRRSRSTWRPDSALRNSMMEERASTTAWLEWRRFWACSSTSSSRWCSVPAELRRVAHPLAHQGRQEGRRQHIAGAQTQGPFRRLGTAVRQQEEEGDLPLPQHLGQGVLPGQAERQHHRSQAIPVLLHQEPCLAAVPPPPAGYSRFAGSPAGQRGQRGPLPPAAGYLWISHGIPPFPGMKTRPQAAKRPIPGLSCLKPGFSYHSNFPLPRQAPKGLSGSGEVRRA